MPDYGSSDDASLLRLYGLELCTYNDGRTTIRERMGISKDLADAKLELSP
jgi:hypothetical protein